MKPMLKYFVIALCVALLLITVGPTLNAVLFGDEHLVPCAKHEGELCEKKKECVLNCTLCSEDNDKCCCLHVDICTCVDPTRGTRCCDGN